MLFPCHLSASTGTEDNYIKHNISKNASVTTIKNKKNKPGFVTFDDLQPGNKVSLF